MRSLIFAAAAAGTLGIAPASAQTVYVDDGYVGYRSGYSNWGGPGVGILRRFAACGRLCV
jgi:hypothetical protein